MTQLWNLLFTSDVYLDLPSQACSSLWTSTLTNETLLVAKDVAVFETIPQLRDRFALCKQKTVNKSKYFNL